MRGYAGFVIISRVLGLIREILLARAYGTTMAAGALSVAQAVPNLARSVTSEEFAQAAVAPVLGVGEGDDRRRAVRTAVLVSMVLSVGGSVLAGGMFLGARVIADVVVPLSDPEYLESVARLLRRLAWMPALSGAAVGGMAVLVVDRRLTRLAASIAATNVPIVALLMIRPTADVTLAAWAIVGGFLFQLMVVWAGGHHRVGSGGAGGPGLASHRGELRAFASLAVAAVVAIAASSVSGVVDVAYATLVDPGAPAAFDRAYRLALVPFGLVVGYLGGHLVADLVRAGRSADEDVTSLRDALRVATWTLSGAALLLAVAGRPLVVAAFERGEWGAEATDLTTSALVGLAVSLPGLGLGLLASRAWTSMRRAWVPAMAGIGGAGLNLLLDHLLWSPFGLAGIGAATGATHAVVGTALLVGYARTRGRPVREVLLPPLPAVLALAVCVGVWRSAPAVGSVDAHVVGAVLGSAVFVAIALAVDRPVVEQLLRGGRRTPPR